jgi:RNA polymerase sigma-70 factor (ECF subfamily)
MKQVSFQNDILPLKNGLYRLALRITMDSAEAEDIVQETLIKVWKKRDSWSMIDNMEAFCTTICRNLALDYLKKMENQNDSIEAGQIDKADTASNPYEKTQVTDNVIMVRKIISQLPEKQRSCMQLRDFEGKSYKEIALVLGLTEEQVKVNIFRARQTVKQKFTKIDNYGL